MFSILVRHLVELLELLFADLADAVVGDFLLAEGRDIHWQADTHEEAGEGLGEVFAVGR